MTDACSRCGGMMEFKADEFGPYLRCYFCGHHIDLLQDPLEIIALRMKIDHHSEHQEREKNTGQFKTAPRNGH